MDIATIRAGSSRPQPPSARRHAGADAAGRSPTARARAAAGRHAARLTVERGQRAGGSRNGAAPTRRRGHSTAGARTRCGHVHEAIHAADAASPLTAATLTRYARASPTRPRRTGCAPRIGLARLERPRSARHPAPRGVPPRRTAPGCPPSPATSTSRRSGVARRRPPPARAEWVSRTGSRSSAPPTRSPGAGARRAWRRRRGRGVADEVRACEHGRAARCTSPRDDGLSRRGRRAPPTGPATTPRSRPSRARAAGPPAHCVRDARGQHGGQLIEP